MHQRGNITVPFPFGLEEGCSARRLFQLNCSDPAHSVLQYNDQLHVTYIDVSEGLVSMKFNLSWEHLSTELDMPITYQLAKQNASGYACVSNHSTCLSVISSSEGYVGYRCKCSPGFEGNPYIQDGCSGTLYLPLSLPPSLPIMMITKTVTQSQHSIIGLICIHVIYLCHLVT